MLSCASIALPAAPGSAPPLTYVSRAGSNFTLYSNLSTQAEAQAVCLREGGHLASFASEAEQYEVESFVSIPGPELGGCYSVMLWPQPGCWCS